MRTIWSRGVTANTLDPESSDRGSNPRETFLCSICSDCAMVIYGSDMMHVPAQTGCGKVWMQWVHSMYGQYRPQSKVVAPCVHGQMELAHSLTGR